MERELYIMQNKKQKYITQKSKETKTIIIDRVNEQREKDKFFRSYRNKWSRIFGRMTMKQENELWDMWMNREKK